MTGLRALLRPWRRLGLSAQFMTASIGLMVVILSVAGVLQSWWLTRGLLDANARIASVYMEAIIAPHLKANAGPSLSAEQHREIEADVEALMSKSGILAVTLWRPDGTVLFSTWEGLAGRRFDSTEVKGAAAGQIAQDFLEPEDHNKSFQPGTRDIVEIYIPIRDSSGQIVAVGEFYQSLSIFRGTLGDILVGSWSIRIFFSLLAVLVLFLLVRNASRTIEKQRIAIRRQAQNTLRYRREIETLRAHSDRSRYHAAQASELLLSRIGAEIHDGPVQVLTLAMLQLGGLQPSAQGAAPSSGPPGPGELMTEAVSQLRSMSAGLILPELEDLSLEETIRLVVARHERLTGTTVRVLVAALPATSLEMRACIYRVVQEALNNAARHAGGRGQKVEAGSSDGVLRFMIEDAGSGIAPGPVEDDRPRLGLLAARHRVETFGGTIVLDSEPGRGTRVVATFPVESLGLPQTASSRNES